MRRTNVKSIMKKLMLMLCMVFALSACVSPIETEASWIDRGATGIYGGNDFGYGLGDYSEEDTPVPEEEDEGRGLIGDITIAILGTVIATPGILMMSIMEGLGASLDTLVFGRLVNSNTLFTFDLGQGNMYGIVGAAMYGVLAVVIATLMIPVLTGKISISAWRRGDIAKASLKEAVTYFVTGLLLLGLMPYFLDVALFIRDLILYFIGTVVTPAVLGGNYSPSIVATLAGTATKDLLSAIVFDVAIVLNLYYLISYVGIALSMTSNFILFPIVVLKSSFDKQIIKGWASEMLSCMMVPVIDACLLLLPSFAGIYASGFGFTDNLFGIALIQLIICYMTIPVRNYARGVLGLKANPLENAGFAAIRTMAGAATGLAMKRALTSSGGDKKNAEADRERANMEDDLSRLEREREAEEMSASRLASAQQKMASTDELKASAAGTDEKLEEQIPEDDASGNDLSDINELKSKRPLGREQSYAEGAKAHIQAEKSELSNGELPKEASLSPDERMENKRKLDELNKELEASNAKMDDYEEKKNAILNDDSLTTEEKTEKLNELKDLQGKEKGKQDKIKKQKNDVMSVDDKLQEANQDKRRLQDEADRVDADPNLTQKEKEEKLNSLSDQIQEVDQRITDLQGQKRLLQVEHEKRALAKEPTELRKELGELNATADAIGQERDELVRQRNEIQSKQNEHAYGTAEYKTYGEQISKLNEQIGLRDQVLSDCEIQRDTVKGALQKQEAGLYDRQAYNLHERVQAQAQYEKAKEDYDYHQGRLKEMEKSPDSWSDKSIKSSRAAADNAKAEMKKAEERIAQLTTEDRKIAERIKEISPDHNQYSMEELSNAKSSQTVRRAELQKEVARLQLDTQQNPKNMEENRFQIARLQSEIADCNLNSARIDQMMGIMKGKAQRKGSASRNAGVTSISDEYDRKRAAIMERYANIDNFENPEFAGISREKRAQLYRERALRTQNIQTRMKVMSITGTALGAVSGLWLGGAGVAGGAVLGYTAGSALGKSSAMKLAEETRSMPVDYSNKPLDFHVSGDFRDNTDKGMQDTVLRIKANLSESLRTEKFTEAVKSELVSRNIIENCRKELFRKYNVNKDNYVALRNRIVPELCSDVFTEVKKSEKNIVETCAGKEYAKLSDEVRDKIIDSVGEPVTEIIENLVVSCYLREKWNPEYEVDDNDR